jgi:tyrosyl-DNA phosphodiesterase 2
MDELVAQQIKLVEAKKRGSVPWKANVPHNQPYYNFDGKQWKAQKPESLSPKTSHSRGEISKLALYSWNIDFMLPFAESRMSAALSHLQKLITHAKDPDSTAKVVYLQECVASDVALISNNPWVRETFALSDVDTENWQSGHYGTISLIDRRLPIASCFRVHYSETRMERDGLFVDVEAKGKTIRFCNTHLESLAFEPPRRIPQMKLCAEYMRDKSVDGALLAGDLNAIQDFDLTLHSENGLKDAYLELGGVEGDTDGHTWGQQAATVQRERFATSRMDKVFFHGGVELLSFEQFGKDVLVEDGSEQEMLMKLGFDKPWVTDHLGVTATFAVNDESPRGQL